MLAPFYLSMGLLGAVALGLAAFGLVAWYAGAWYQRQCWEREDDLCSLEDQRTWLLRQQRELLRGEIRAALGRYEMAQRRRRQSSGGLDRFACAGEIG